jgi:chromosome segregation ATPase
VSFDYDKIKPHNDHASWWTSYADLFMMLSIVFLLMFVCSSLREGSAGFQQQQEYKQLAQRASDLEEQIKVYNTLKDEALKKQSNEAEQEVYQKLMGKLDLLKDDAHQEKEALQKQAKENEAKEYALNQYQQMIRNIINANVLAKTQIEHRDQLIVSKDMTIAEKRQKIEEMQKIINKNDKEIEDINTQLADRIEALRNEQQRSKTSKAILEKRIAKLKEDSQEQIDELQGTNRGIALELNQVQGTLQQTQQQLGQAHETIEQQQQENTALESKLQADKARFTAEIEDMNNQHNAQLAREKAAFENKLKSQRLTAAARAKKLAAYMEGEKEKLAEKLNGLKANLADTENKLASTENALNGTKGQLAQTEGALANTQNQLQGTKGQLEQTQNKLAGTVGALEETKGALAATKGQLDGTKGALAATKNELAGANNEKARALASVATLKDDLARTQEIANARKKLAAQIADQFAKSGMKGAVNGRTGEVTLDFGGEYFDTGSTSLKPKMRTTLDKFMPVYARSLFSDPTIADKIASVEIVGFASSTYKGRYVNPKSTRPGDKDAIDYNLRLSFGRANSIFKHVLNQENLTPGTRDKLMPLLKVVGRGYLPDGMTETDLPVGMTEHEFCAKYNCAKAQKVIVKFNMKD